MTEARQRWGVCYPTVGHAQGPACKPLPPATQGDLSAAPRASLLDAVIHFTQRTWATAQPKPSLFRARHPGDLVLLQEQLGQSLTILSITPGEPRLYFTCLLSSLSLLPVCASGDPPGSSCRSALRLLGIMYTYNSRIQRTTVNNAFSLNS